MGESLQELHTFVNDWTDTDEKNKESFIRLKSQLEAKEEVRFEFVPRPGVTYSLRAGHPGQTQRTLFVMVDVIEDDPRWLSVCFYGETTTDPDERGDFVPQGLLGEDAVCFDIDQYDDELLRYIESRIDEAYEHALKGT